MRIAVFSLVFMILAAMASLAQGLEITRIDAHVDYDDSYVYRIEQEQKSTRRNSAIIPVADSSKIEVDVFPGSNLTLTATIENTFKGDELIIRDIFTEATIEGIEGGTDLKAEDGNIDLEPGNDAKADITLQIPHGIDEGMHNVIIEAEGEGKNNIFYRAEVRLVINIMRLSHDLRITNILLEPSLVSCNRKAKVAVEIANAGSNIEDEVALEIKIPSIAFNSYDKGISLAPFSSEAEDAEFEYKRKLGIEAPSFLKSGKYPVFVNLYWKGFVIFDQKTVELSVKDCSRDEIKTIPKQEGNETALLQTPEQANEIPKGIITATEEFSVFDSPVFLSAMLGGVLIMFAVSAFVVFGLLRRSKVL